MCDGGCPAGLHQLNTVWAPPLGGCPAGRHQINTFLPLGRVPLADPWPSYILLLWPLAFLYFTVCWGSPAQGSPLGPSSLSGPLAFSCLNIIGPGCSGSSRSSSRPQIHKKTHKQAYLTNSGSKTLGEHYFSHNIVLIRDVFCTQHRDRIENRA